MKLGVDLGTTRTIVATADRGNYPVVTFYDGDGEPHEHLPSVVALDGDRLVFGFEALTTARTGAPLTRSFKRVLAAPDVTAETPVTIGTRQVPVLELLTAYAAALRTALVEQSSLSGELTVGSELLAAVGVPAHAHGPQRFLTLEAFRRAGFTVVAMPNEPSAAGFEFTHRRRREITRNRTRVVVYDLGGGTFDASVVDVAGTHHEVLGTVGLNHVGGDDFDPLLADLAAESIHQRVDDLTAADRDDLLEQARELKEHLSPQTRRLTLEVARTEVGVPVTAFYDRATPLVEQTMDAMGPLMGAADDHVDELHDVAGIYLVGGASGLPLVPRLLRERFGRRVHRSPLPAASTAIGLAIATDDDACYSLRDRLSRGFGVFRELRDGEAVGFDPILGRTDVLDPSGCRTATRRYRAAHDVGWYRYVEHTDLDEHGGPTGDLVPFAEVLFPFDPALRDGRDLTRVPVQRRDDGPLVEERYTLDEHGIVQVRITDLDSGYSQVHALRADG